MKPRVKGPSKSRVPIPQARIDEFCRRHHIRRLALFGSVLRDDFRLESDVDVLVEFDAEHIPGLMDLARMEIELSENLHGHKADMNTPRMLSKYYRDEVLEEAEVIYDEA